jgi:tryptophan synthase alpha chain
MVMFEKKFKELKEKNKKAFIPYICFGYPSIKSSIEIIIQLSRQSADIVEIGFPFSDPLADGPVIQHASQSALKNLVTVENFFNAVKIIRKETSIPLLMMSYYNPIFKYQVDKFIKKSVSCGLNGVIVPDLPYEEAYQIRKLSEKEKNFCFINFISPVTDIVRAKKIAKKSKGFIYYVSITGVTGRRNKLSFIVKKKVKKLKKITDVPICVGFGISNPLHVKDIASEADGVIVGSALINKINENINSKLMVKKVLNFSKKLNSATFL